MPPHHTYSYEEVKLKMNMTKLWTDHTIWTRMFIVDLLTDSPSIETTTERLLKNQETIGNIMEEFYGETASESITSLLKSYVNIITELLKAIKIGNTTQATNLETDIVTNIESIAILFATINPYYCIDELTDLFNTQTILIRYQFIARKEKDYIADIMYYDMGLHHIFMISDYLTDGIFARFFEEELFIIK